MGVSAELKQGAKLDLLTYLVGKRKTTRLSVYADELPGEGCEGATHFVRQADVGAFAMTSGTEIAAGAAAQAFGQGVSGDSQAKETRDTSDGDPNKCKASANEDDQPPSGCNAMIRVKLFPIKPGQRPAQVDDEKGVDDPIECPEGLVNVDSLCQPDTASLAYRLCPKGDAEQCKEQCLNGSDQSCGRLGNLSKYYKDASPAFSKRLEQACSSGIAPACSGLVSALYQANKQKYKNLRYEKDPAKQRERREALQPLTDRMYALTVNGCVGGDSESCRMVTQEIYFGSSPHLGERKNHNEFFAVMRRGCDAGSAFACWRYAVMSLDRQDRDVKLSLRYLNRACLGQYLPACMAYAALHSSPSECVALQEAPRRCDWMQRGQSCKQLRVHDMADGPSGNTAGASLCSPAVLGAISGDKATIAQAYKSLACREGSDSSIYVSRSSCQ